eukprot:COSAG02_NODE_27094_length_617_cov_0.837838_1_plen_65_part_00
MIDGRDDGERAGLLTVAARAGRRSTGRRRRERVVVAGLAVARDLQSVLVQERELVQARIAASVL